MIFDMDGVITDEARYWEVSRELGQELTGRQMPFSFIRAMKNQGTNSNWEILYEFVSHSGTFDYQELKRSYNALLRTTNPPERLLVPAGTLLEIAGGRKAYVCTGRPLPEANAALEQLGVARLFSGVYSTEERSKENVFRRLNSGPVFSDTVSDMRAAKSAGLRAVGVYGALDNKDALSSAGADILIRDLTEWKNEP